MLFLFREKSRENVTVYFLAFLFHEKSMLKKDRENTTGFLYVFLLPSFISREKQFRKSRENARVLKYFCFKQFLFNERTVVKKS